MGVARLDYVEFPVVDCATSKSFFEAAFGWSLAQFGPTYASTTTGDVDIGLDSTPGETVAAPLAVIRVDDLKAARSDVIAAGGTLTRDIFAFPGGRRFHFREPGGCELAVWVTE
jgi:predicted enzyme related to lactoylglutathione lyase